MLIDALPVSRIPTYLVVPTSIMVNTLFNRHFLIYIEFTHTNSVSLCDPVPDRSRSGAADARDDGGAPQVIPLRRRARGSLGRARVGA